MVTIEVLCMEAESTKPWSFINSYVELHDMRLDYIYYTFEPFTCQTTCINERCIISKYQLHKDQVGTQYTKSDGLDLIVFPNTYSKGLIKVQTNTPKEYEIFIKVFT